MDKEFLADLPSRNVQNFSGMKVIPKNEDKVKVAYDVPHKRSEQKIVNDNKPCVLRFLETHYPKKHQEATQVSKKGTLDSCDSSLPDGKHKKATRKN